MRKIFGLSGIVIVGVTLLCAQLGAQQLPDTNAPALPVLSGPMAEALSFASGLSTNWGFAGYGIASTASRKYGGGLAALYKLNDFVVPTLRLDYYDGRVWMPSATLNLQAPITLFGKFTAIPFAFTGLATPLTGKGNENFSAVGMAGVGMAVRLVSHLDAVVDIEKWSGFKDEQVRLGLVWKVGW